MSAIYLLVFVFVLIIILMVSLIFTRGYRAWIYRLFSVVFAVFLLFIGFLAIGTSFSADPVEIKTTNYSSQKGYLYFFDSHGCTANIRYGYPVNANEESWLEVDEKNEQPGEIILLADDGMIYKIPSPDYDKMKLDIWEKELTPGDECFRAQINAYRREQIFFSIAIGLLLFGLLFLFGYRRKFKHNVRKGIA